MKSQLPEILHKVLHQEGIPDVAVLAGHQQLMPYLIVADAALLIRFLQIVFDATEQLRVPGPDGGIQYAEVQIGEARILISDASPAWPPVTSGLYLYVADTDTTYYRALEAGGTTIMAPAQEVAGARGAGFRDPFGNTWWLATIPHS